MEPSYKNLNLPPKQEVNIEELPLESREALIANLHMYVGRDAVLEAMRKDGVSDDVVTQVEDLLRDAA